MKDNVKRIRAAKGQENILTEDTPDNRPLSKIYEDF